MLHPSIELVLSPIIEPGFAQFKSVVPPMESIRRRKLETTSHFFRQGKLNELYRLCAGACAVAMASRPSMTAVHILTLCSEIHLRRKNNKIHSVFESRFVRWNFSEKLSIGSTNVPACAAPERKAFAIVGEDVVQWWRSSRKNGH